MDNFYEVLGCKETATLDEIKKSYQRLIKQHHPDKGAQTTEQFILINRAYETLKDEQKRRDYDASLLSNTCNDQSLIYAELQRDDIHLDSNGLAYYPCRCGNHIVIEAEHLVVGECSIECCECSNSILIR